MLMRPVCPVTLDESASAGDVNVIATIRAAIGRR
jgi:hypothetical protein